MSFYYSILSDAEKKLYQKIYDGILNFEPAVDFLRTDFLNLNDAEIMNIFGKIQLYVSLDYPQIFYVDFSRTVIRYTFSSVIFKPLYFADKEKASKLKWKVETCWKKILGRVMGNSQEEKERAVHDLLIKNILYDELSLVDADRYSWSASTIMGILFSKNAVCSGISKTVKVLFNRLGIRCIVAIGNAKGSTVAHAWNIVQISGKNYHLDVTGDLNEVRNGKISYRYFNLTDSQIKQDYEWTINYHKC